MNSLKPLKPPALQHELIQRALVFPVYDAFTLARLQAGSEQVSAALWHGQASFSTLSVAPGLPRGLHGSFINHDDILPFDASACLVFERSEMFMRKNLQLQLTSYRDVWRQNVWAGGLGTELGMCSLPSSKTGETIFDPKIDFQPHSEDSWNLSKTTRVCGAISQQNLLDSSCF